MKQNFSLKYIIALQAAVILYTCTDIAAKLASNFPFFSLGFVLSYGVEIMLLGLYAIVWQQIHKTNRHFHCLFQPRIGHFLVYALGCHNLQRTYFSSEHGRHHYYFRRDMGGE